MLESTASNHGGMMRLERLHLEVTNVCNFKCEFCPDAIMNRRRGHMDLALLEKALNEIASTQIARIVTFHLMGEPLIYPHIFDAIQMAVERGIELHLTTNGSTFALKADHIQRLVDSGIPKVTLSLQTPDPESFTIRGAPPALTPNSYFAGITRYIQAHLRSKQTTRVHLKFLDTSPHPFLVPHKALSVIDSGAAMREELLAWAARIFTDQPQAPTLDWIQNQIGNHRPGRWQLLPLTDRFALETFPLDSWGNVESDRVFLARMGYCNGAAGQAGVLYDGTVVPCCKDYEGLIPLGNLREQSLAQILTGESACGLRQGFDRFQVENPVCQRCMGGDTRRKTWLRQLGSIAYFKVYRPLMQAWVPGWGEV